MKTNPPIPTGFPSAKSAGHSGSESAVKNSGPCPCGEPTFIGKPLCPPCWYALPHDWRHMWDTGFGNKGTLRKLILDQAASRLVILKQAKTEARFTPLEDRSDTY